MFSRYYASSYLHKMTQSAKVEFICIIVLLGLMMSSGFPYMMGMRKVISHSPTMSPFLPTGFYTSHVKRKSHIQRSATSSRNVNSVVLDRPTTIERRPEQAPVKARRRMASGPWEVRIYNDGMNTREFVARCLVQYAGLGESAAYQTMMQAHQNGIAVVGRYVYELAEMYHDALKHNGIICDLIPVDNVPERS